MEDDERQRQIDLAWAQHTGRSYGFQTTQQRIKFRTLLAGEQGWRCAYCGTRMCPEQQTLSCVTVEHVVPQRQGGSDAYENCVAVCWKCNNLKSDLTCWQTIAKMIGVPVERIAWMPHQELEE